MDERRVRNWLQIGVAAIAIIGAVAMGAMRLSKVDALEKTSADHEKRLVRIEEKMDFVADGVKQLLKRR